MMLLAVGICQSVPYLLNRVWVYEIAIGSGFFFVSGAVFCLTRGLASRRETFWLAAGGLMFGLAMASRPHLALAAAVAGALLAKHRGLLCAIRWRLSPRDLWRSRWQWASEFERFEIHSSSDSAINWPDRARTGSTWQRATFCPARFTCSSVRPTSLLCFPGCAWCCGAPMRPRVPSPSNYFAEATAGALWIAPFLIGAAFLARRRRRRRATRRRAWFCESFSCRRRCWSCSFMSTHLATQRYEVDFLPLAVLAALAHFAIHQARRPDSFARRSQFFSRLRLRTAWL